MFGFHHFGTEVFYTEDFNSYKVCDGSGEDSSCSDKFWLPIGFNDHNNIFHTSGSCSYSSDLEEEDIETLRPRVSKR